MCELCKDGEMCIIMKLAEAEKHIKELEEELKLSDELLEDKKKLLKAIPQCVAHGPCVPHALEWIAQVKTLAKVIVDG